jgi:E3 ubiquitin-protein ligase SHPRH
MVACHHGRSPATQRSEWSSVSLFPWVRLRLVLKIRNMVSHIPRVHALAMSGTPAKNDVSDLMGSLRFLRVPVLPQSTHLWHRLQQAPMQDAFEGIFSQIAVRTTKREVAGEFSLPSQTRLVVPIELSEIELHYYNDTLDRQRDLLHLPVEPGAERPADWRLDRPLFRACLKNLRQICTHIQVGQMQQQHIARGPRLHLGRDLMTMAEALQKMRDDHAQELLIESRVQVRTRWRKSH